jgi:hypothetical protein
VPAEHREWLPHRHGVLSITRATLYRWRAGYRDEGLAGLLDGHGHRAGSSVVEGDLATVILAFQTKYPHAGASTIARYVEAVPEFRGKVSRRTHFAVALALAARQPAARDAAGESGRVEEPLSGGVRFAVRRHRAQRTLGAGLDPGRLAACGRPSLHGAGLHRHLLAPPAARRLADLEGAGCPGPGAALHHRVGRARGGPDRQRQGTMRRSSSSPSCASWAPSKTSACRLRRKRRAPSSGPSARCRTGCWSFCPVTSGTRSPSASSSAAGSRSPSG